ncbi:hypothetical protein H8E88_27255 [candidate division KSB1 bacterium]|nr:hypothetical protein [candidate division KSB1 bacterium]
MQLPLNSLIAQEKIKDYLLTHRIRNDKSKWLAYSGYTLENWQLLENDLRSQMLHRNATLIENTQYGQMYEIKGELKGPNSKILFVCTIWMKEHSSGLTKFITMYPDKRRNL